MIPTRAVMPSRTFPAITVLLMALHAAAFLYARWSGALLPRGLGDEAGGLPALAEAIVYDSALRLAADMAALWLFGENVEDRTGRLRFAAFYLLCGLAAVIGSLAADPASMIRAFGASGAVAGVIGAHLALFPQSRALLLVPVPPAWTTEVPALALVAFWAALHLALGVLPAMITHDTPFWDTGASGIIVAMAGGAIAVRAFTRRERMRPEWWHDRR